MPCTALFSPQERQLVANSNAQQRVRGISPLELPPRRPFCSSSRAESGLPCIISCRDWPRSFCQVAAGSPAPAAKLRACTRRPSHSAARGSGAAAGLPLAGAGGSPQPRTEVGAGVGLAVRSPLTLESTVISRVDVQQALPSISLDLEASIDVRLAQGGLIVLIKFTGNIR